MLSAYLATELKRIVKEFWGCIAEVLFFSNCSPILFHHFGSDGAPPEYDSDQFQQTHEEAKELKKNCFRHRLKKTNQIRELFKCTDMVIVEIASSHWLSLLMERLTAQSRRRLALQSATRLIIPSLDSLVLYLWQYVPHLAWD